MSEQPQNAAEQNEAIPPDHAPVESDELTALKAELENCQQQLGESRDQVLRAHAEMQNLRRRAEADVEKAHKFALEKFAGALLSVVDNLERGMEAARAENADLGSIVEGMELTYKGFIDTLERFQLTQINPVGEAFDPQWHEAISMVPGTAAPANSVLNVVQKGYALNGRVLRAAMVVVAKGEAPASSSVDTSA